MDGKTALPPSVGTHDMSAAHWGARMAKWRRWAEEMRANGWDVNEPEKRPATKTP